MTLGSRLRAARVAAELTQTDLAYALRDLGGDLARTDAKRVSEWENDKVPRIPFYVVAGIASVTGRPLDYFATGGAGADASDAAAGGGRLDAAAEGMAMLEQPRRRSRTARSRRGSAPDR